MNGFSNIAINDLASTSEGCEICWIFRIFFNAFFVCLIPACGCFEFRRAWSPTWMPPSSCPKKQSSSHWSRSFIARTQPRDGGRGLFWNHLILQFVSRCMVAKNTLSSRSAAQPSLPRLQPSASLTTPPNTPETQLTTPSDSVRISAPERLLSLNDSSSTPLMGTTVGGSRVSHVASHVCARVLFSLPVFPDPANGPILEGEVAAAHPEKGFGFLRDNLSNTANIFLHVSRLHPPTDEFPPAGAHVRYQLEDESKGKVGLLRFWCFFLLFLSLFAWFAFSLVCLVALVPQKLGVIAARLCGFWHWIGA